MTLDSSVFLPGAIDPETAAFNTRIETMTAALPPAGTIPLRLLREELESGIGALWPIVRIGWGEDRTIPGPEGNISVRVFAPKEVKGVYLHFHGGAFVFGSAHHQDMLLATIAETCAVAVVSVDYRLAPEHPHPAGVDDCEAAAVWLAANAQREFGAQSLIIGGESAGATLAVATLLRMRDRHGFTGFAAANLTCGGFDLSLTPSARRWGERNPILSTPIFDWCQHLYAPPEKHRDPDVSPLFAELSNMPPALFTVGTLDPVLDDSLFMHARWCAAGNEAELAVYPGGMHGFIAFPLEIGRNALALIYAFIAAAVAR